MPTYGPGEHTYTVPSGVYEIEIIAVGAGGGGGGGGNETSSNGTGGSGGTGGYADGRLSVSPGDQLTLQVASSGSGGASATGGGGGGSGGSSAFYNGGNGADSPNYSGAGGGGGGATRVQHNSSTVLIVEGGGGGGGGNGGGTGGGGGGGGARGGSGGTGGFNNLPADDGQSASGSGSGGDGGNGGGQFDFDGVSGQPGGSEAPGLTNASTSTGGGASGGAAGSVYENGSNGDNASIIINQPPSPPSVSATSETDTSVTIDIGDAIAEDSATLEYRDADNAGWSTAANYYAGQLPVTETVGGLANGTTYEFRVQVSNNLGSAISNSVSRRTELPAPTGLSVTSTTITSIGIEWTANHSNDETRIDYRQSGAGSWTTDQTVSAGLESATIEGLHPDQSFDIRVVAVTDETSSATSTTATTEPLAPILGSLDAGVEGEITVRWSLQDDRSDGNVEIYRSTDGSLGSVVATISDPQSQMSYTDTAVLDGTTYHYTIRRNAEGASADSNQESATTILPAPGSHAAVDARDEEIDLEWTPTHDTGQTRVEYRPTDDATWSVSETVSRTTATISGLCNGEQYDTRVVAETGDAEAASQADQATTTLPDEDQPALGNGVEDEVAVDRGTATTNNGSVRIQIRETEQSSWDSNATGFAEFVGTYDTLAMEFVGREDGEEYEVRARTETEHRTGAWTDPVAIVTQFPGLTNLVATAADPTTVPLTWDDLADNEDGFIVERRRLYDGGWSRWREIAELDPNTESYPAAAPADATVEYRVTSYTPYTSVSQTASTTTPAIGLAPRGVQASGWHVEIDRPDGNGVVKPTILADVESSPRLNATPEVTIPVPRTDKWLDEEWERQPMRVWRDGERLPIEQFDDARIVRGSGGDYVELVGRGGTDLSARYQDEVRDRSAHNVMRDVLDASGYAFTVDPAPASQNEPFGTFVGERDFAEVAQFDTFTDPISIDAGVVEPRRTAYLTPLDEISDTTTPIVSDTTNEWTASNAVEYDVGALRSNEWTVDLDYPIAAEHVGLYFRVAYDFEGFLLVYLDGQKVASIARSSRSNSKAVEWRDMIQLGGFRTVDEIDNLNAGEHTIRVETSDSDPTINESFGPVGSVYLDMPALFDTREWDPSTFANTVDSDGRLTGPPGVYSTQEIDFQIRPIQRATGATLTGTFSDTTNDQAIGIGSIETAIQTTTNAMSIDRDFGSSTRDFIARIELGGADGDQADGPNDGVETFYTTYQTVPQQLTELTVEYDALGSPSITESIDNPLAEVLSDKADRANCVWEVQWDSDLGEPRVVVTQPGQRTDDADPDLASYELKKNLAREVSGTTIYGRTQRREDERFDAQTIGVTLDNDNIQGGSERVYDDSGTVYESVEGAGEETSGDYEMDYEDGRISVLNEGSMSLTESYNIDYDWHPVGSVERNVDFEKHLVETLNGIRSDPAAQEAASFLVDALDVPQWEAEVTIPQREAGFALVDAIAPSQLPNPEGERYEIRSVSEGAGEISLTLGARLSAGEVIRQIEQTLGRTAREV